DAKPGEVFVNGVLKFRPTARGIDILDAQQECPAALPRQIEIELRRVGVAEMEETIRARREAENGWRHVFANSSCPGLTRASITRRLLSKMDTRVKPACDGLSLPMLVHFETQSDLDDAIQILVKQDPRLKPVFAATGIPALRQREPGFAG